MFNSHFHPVLLNQNYIGQSQVRLLVYLALVAVYQKILSRIVILSMDKTMVTRVISELKSVSRLKFFPETAP